MKICVFGAGAIGGQLATHLVRGGATVSVVARGPHLAAIRRNGLTVRTRDGELHARVEATDDPATLGAQDAVIVAVKAPALPAVAATIAPLLRPDTPVAFVMNGIPWFYFHALGGKLDDRRLPGIDPGNELWRVVGPERAIAGVIYAASAVVEPGVIEIENPNCRLILGEPDGRVSERAQSIAALIDAGGMTAIVSPVIRDEIWNKLLNNLANGPLTVLVQATLRKVYEDPACVEAARRIMTEAAAVAIALGAAPDLDNEKRIAHTRRLDHKPSILQDLQLGRPMEINGMFDAPVELARMVGAATPTLDLFVALLKARARSAGLYAG